ncbi:MAG: hypothetical protein ACIALR_08045 [Blastopirellula sp. JB062]
MTSITTATVEWALLYGHARFPVLFVRDRDAAEVSARLLIDLLRSPRIRADFPAARRAFLMGRDRVVLPNVATASFRFIGSQLRGMIHTLPTGERIRPDLVVIDEPRSRRDRDDVTKTFDKFARRMAPALGGVKPIAVVRALSIDRF